MYLAWRRSKHAANACAPPPPPATHARWGTPNEPSTPPTPQVRGSGLLVGVQLDFMAGKVVEAARDAGLIIITAGKGDVVRLVPPLVITNDEIDHCCTLLSRLLAEAV